jgi:DNA-directed RNA polymerase specialized sigma subunit
MMKYDPPKHLSASSSDIEILMMPFAYMDASELGPPHEAIEAVTQAMSMLKEEEQWILYRIFYDRTTYQELTNNLGIKAKSQAWTKTQTALKNLKKELLKHPMFQHLQD